MKNIIFSIILCTIAIVSTVSVKAEENEGDPLQVFVNDLCDEDALYMMILEMVEFQAAAGYEQSAPDDMTIDEYIEYVVYQAEQELKDETLELSYCEVLEIEEVDCSEAAEFIIEGDNLDFDLELDQILDAFDYLNVSECLITEVSVIEEGADVFDGAYIVAGNTGDFWRLLYFEIIPDPEGADD